MNRANMGKQTKSGGSSPKPVIYINVWDKQKVINPQVSGFECKIGISGKISIEMTEDDIDSGQILISIVDKHLFSSIHFSLQ